MTSPVPGVWPVDQSTLDLLEWALTDHLNTVRDIARYDSQSDTTTVVNHLVYDAYGNVTSETDSAVNSLFLFTARPLDPDTGLQNNLNRWYDPSVGRWLSEDPAQADINLYRYAGNYPVFSTDPHGLRLVQCAYYDATPSEVPQQPVYKLIQVPDTWNGGDPCKIVLGSSIFGYWYEVPLKSKYRPGFKICRRDIQGGNCCDDLAAAIGNCCGGAHTYIQFGGVDANGNPLPGTWGLGIGGGSAGTLPLPELHFHPDSCFDLTACNAPLKYGKGAGKIGAKATDDEIKDCLSKVPMSKPYGMTSYNCKDWAEEAAAACGLCGG